MTDIRDLLGRLAAEEERLLAREFLAPCVGGGRVRTNVGGLLYTFDVRPSDYEGWGVFRPAGESVAQFAREATFVQIAEYLKLFPIVRLRLAYQLRGATWLAYPAGEADFRQRFATSAEEVRPVLAHLVADGRQFEQIVARALGGNFWCEEADRRADPLDAEKLRQAWGANETPEALAWKNLTPEMRTCYSLVFRRAEQERERERRRKEARREARATRDEQRLRDALRFGGGALREYRDRGDFWLVEWTTCDGERHTSAIAKADLTVLSAGICLSGEDRKFDLQSLVGVVDGNW